MSRESVRPMDQADDWCSNATLGLIQDIKQATEFENNPRALRRSHSGLVTSGTEIQSAVRETSQLVKAERKRAPRILKKFRAKAQAFTQEIPSVLWKHRCHPSHYLHTLHSPVPREISAAANTAILHCPVSLHSLTIVFLLLSMF